MEVGPTKTPQSNRPIMLSRPAVEALQEVKRQQDEDRSLFGEAWEDSGCVFTKADGQPLHPSYVGQRFRRDVAWAGVPVVRFHDLRHAFATSAMAQGMNPKAVQEVLGHTQVQTTLSIYAHVMPRDHQRVVDAVGVALFGAVGEATVTNGVIGDGVPNPQAETERSKSLGL